MTTELLQRIALALERSAVASERLIELADEEQTADAEPAPPFCPHCGKINPAVNTYTVEATGDMADFALQLQCCHCNMEFVAGVEAWLVAQNPVQLQEYFDAKKGGNNEGS